MWQVQNSDEVVAVPLGELPDDPEELLEVLQAEEASLTLWLDFAKAYLARGQLRQCLAILEAGTSQEARPCLHCRLGDTGPPQGPSLPKREVEKLCLDWRVTRLRQVCVPSARRLMAPAWLVLRRCTTTSRPTQRVARGPWRSRLFISAWRCAVPSPYSTARRCLLT